MTEYHVPGSTAISAMLDVGQSRWKSKATWGRECVSLELNASRGLTAEESPICNVVVHIGNNDVSMRSEYSSLSRLARGDGCSP